MIVLASASPRRKEILEKFFEILIYPSKIEEESDAETPEDIAMDIAEKKASDVASKFPGDTVVGADTIVVFKGRILGKPRDLEEARKMLKMLSDNIHKVITGYCIVHKGNMIKGFEETEVKFRKLDDELIEWYLSTEEWKDKAGAYGIQGYASIFVEWIRGDYFNVVGLPTKVIVELIKLGFRPKR
ncbi:Maf-like protein [Pyrococcus sp. NA2]|uniref:Maf family protein n=1 Tax=Pyrococcus sp. (strain NA2) TaxID=342949 RepID=UPI000209AFDD|nr:nucleoside triphosphate pyrophosphatase [Pyrococcus sp. NA2]AEC51780.1 Maf-like protein [Pyrococcus sp. NA2]